MAEAVDPYAEWTYDQWRAEVRSLAKLSENWDSYHAGPIDPKAIASALDALDVLEQAGVEPPRCGPTPGEGVVLIWRGDNDSLDFDREHPGPSPVIEALRALVRERDTLVKAVEALRDNVIGRDADVVKAWANETLAARVAALTEAEKEVSAAYLRIRALVGAWDTRPGGSDRFAVTEARVRSLVAGAAPFEWKAEAPVIGGWYWRERRGEPPEVLQIAVAPAGPRLFAMTQWGGSWEITHDPAARWAGPITPPADPTT